MCRTAGGKGTVLSLLRSPRHVSSFSCASVGSLMPSAQAREERECPACGSDHSQVPAAPLPWRSSTAWPLRCPSSWKTPEKYCVSGAHVFCTMTLHRRSTAFCLRGEARRHQQAGCVPCISRIPWRQKLEVLKDYKVEPSWGDENATELCTTTLESITEHYKPTLPYSTAT